MKNKFRRSMTSVLLAASLLFSSQSVVAFADYGSKSDASDLSPVQESVENATEEQQEDPSLSVEPVIGESTEAPVAAPMMARANAPVAYSAPEVSGYEEYLYYDYSTEFHPDTIAVYTTAGTKDKGNIDSYAFMNDFSRFTSGSSWQSYTVGIDSFKENGWIFKDWGFKFTKGDDSTDLGNQTDFGAGKRYTFSDGSESWGNEYNGGNRISVNALLRADTAVFHYSIFANFNPLVTVNYNKEQGSVTADKPHGNNKFEAEYAQDKVFTITTSSAYKPYVNNTECTLTNSDVENDIYTYTYTLPFVTEPTTLNVEFEKAEDEDTITKDKIDGAVIVTVACDTFPDTHTYKYSLELDGTNDGEHPNYRITKYYDSATLHLLKDGWLHTFVSQPGHEGHSLVDSSSNYINIKLTFDEASGKWKLPENANQYNVTINVKCTSEIPEPDDSIISQLEVALNCVNVTDGSHNDTSKLSTLTTGYYYTCTVDQEKQTATVKIDDTQAKYWIDNKINTMAGKEQHSFVSVSDPITLTYENGQWKVPEDDNAKKIVIKMLCGPSIAQLNDQLNVKMVCDNNGVHSGNNEQFSREYDILADSYHLDMYSVGGEYRCDVTIDAPQYLSKFDQDTNATHVLMSSDNKRTLYYTEDGNWLIVPDEEKTVTFNVSCKPDINFPNPPDKETVLGLIGDVTIQCTTASSGHGQNKYSLTKDDIDFENVVPVQMTAGDEIQFTLPVTIKNAAALQSGFLANYNTLTGKTHIWSSGSIPASITLTYDSVTKAWANKDVNGIVLSVYCTTGGGTIDPNPNPGGGGDNDDDDDRYTGGNTVTRTINDDDVPLNDRPTNTTTIDDEDVPLADLPDDTVTIDDGEVPLKANPSTGDSLPFAAMAAAALSLGGVIVLNRKKK